MSSSLPLLITLSIRQSIKILPQILFIFGENLFGEIFAVRDEMFDDISRIYKEP